MTTLRRPHRLLLAAAALTLFALAGCGGPIQFRPVFGSATSPGPRVYEGGGRS